MGIYSQIPNIITSSRIILIPLFVLVFYVPDNYLFASRNLISATIFVVVGITDWLDGFLARKLGQVSNFGAFLDPVADKLMISTALIILVDLGRLESFLAVIIIGREITISALREWMARLGQSNSVAVSFLGKIKTIFQILAITLLLYFDRIFGINTFIIGCILIYISAILTLWSMGYYLHRAIYFKR